jgi:hypothetical protein
MPIEPPTKTEIEEALSEVFEAWMQHRERRNRRQPSIRMFSAADLEKVGLTALREKSLVENPIGHSLKGAVHKLGQMLATELGSTDALLQVAEKLAKRKPRDYHSRINALDKAFDMIKVGDDMWVA